MNAQAVSGPDTAPGNIASGKAIRQKRPFSFADPAVWRTTGRKAVNGSPSFLIHLFQTVSGHSWHFYPMPASQPESGYRHNGCYVSKHTIPGQGLSAFPAGKRVLPFFLFSSGSPIPGCRILKDKKIIVNRPGKQIFHPSRKNPVSTAPKTSAVKFFVSQRLFFSGGLRFPQFFP